ncbi:MAG: class I SAM-dependent methyltransferase [Chthoniobacterales bacterium]
MALERNVYSARWFEFFHASIDKERTSRETVFIASCAPLPDFRKVLDVCCGLGRHARALSGLGYSVTGIDRDADIIARARELGGGPEYVVADVRNYAPDPGKFDAATVMGQSFGYFDAVTNRDVLVRLANGVRKGGRVILDLWNPEFFAAQQNEAEFSTPSGTVRENKTVNEDRLFVDLEYPGGNREQFEWQLFTPAQMTDLARSVGLAAVVSCTNFDVNIPPASSKPRLQFVLEKQ